MRNAIFHQIDIRDYDEYNSKDLKGYLEDDQKKKQEREILKDKDGNPVMSFDFLGDKNKAGLFFDIDNNKTS